MVLTFPDSLFPDTQQLIPHMGGGTSFPGYSVALPHLMFAKSERWALKAQWNWVNDLYSSDDQITEGSTRRELTSFFSKVRVGRNSFFFPNHTAPQRGTFTGTPVIGVESQTGTNVTFGGGLASEDDWFMPGDFITVNCQMMMVLERVNTNSAGVGSAQLWPPLRVAPDSGATIITSGAFGVFDLVSDPVMPIYRPGYSGTIIIDAIEHISSAELS